MAWNQPTNLADGDGIFEAWVDAVYDSFLFLGALQIGGTAISSVTAGTSAARFATGTYTGNGSTTQAKTGVGFQPDGMFVLATSTSYWSRYATSAMAGNSGTFTPTGVYGNDGIRSLDADGFTVGDGTDGGASYNLNANTIVYAYVAWKV